MNLRIEKRELRDLTISHLHFSILNPQSSSPLVIGHWTSVISQPHFTANTQMAPPCGTSGNSPGRPLLRTPCIPLASTPQPDCTAMYCFPSTMNDDGWPVMPELVGNSHSSLPFFASNAWNMRSLVPPLKTSPPPVASIGPQF